MKKISLNECGSGISWVGPAFGCGSGEFYFKGPHAGLPKYGIAYGNADEVRSKIKNAEDKTMKQLYNQDYVKVLSSCFTEAKWKMEIFLDNVNSLIKEISENKKSIKNKQKKELATQIITELKNKISIAKEVYDILKTVKTVNIPITFEKGNKVFVI